MLKILFYIVVIYLLYVLFLKKENLENVEDENIKKYVAERVIDMIKNNPGISFNTYSSILKENNNQHLNLEKEENFNKFKSLGDSITLNDVLEIL